MEYRAAAESPKPKAERKSVFAFGFFLYAFAWLVAFLPRCLVAFLQYI
jgi:hypothetical protein